MIKKIVSAKERIMKEESKKHSQTPNAKDKRPTFSEKEWEEGLVKMKALENSQVIEESSSQEITSSHLDSKEMSKISPKTSR